MITASKSPVAIREQNFFLLAVAKSFFVATIMFADGYSCRNSAANCSMMWLGTTKIDLLQKSKPFTLHSTEQPFQKSFLLRTSCANSVFLPYKIWAMAFCWCFLNFISGFIPTKFKWLPSYSRGRILLNLSLYSLTNRSLLSTSLKIQSSNACLIWSCFACAMAVSFFLH